MTSRTDLWSSCIQCRTHVRTLVSVVDAQPRGSRHLCRNACTYLDMRSAHVATRPVLAARQTLSLVYGAALRTAATRLLAAVVGITEGALRVLQMHDA